MKTERRQLPSVDSLLSDARLKAFEHTFPRGLVLELVRQHLGQIRLSIGRGNPCPPFQEIVESVYAQVQALTHLSLRPVINATGGTLRTKVVALGARGRRKDIAQTLAQRLRCQEPPVVGRIHDNMLLLDPRSVLPEEDGAVLQALRAAIADLRQP